MARFVQLQSKWINKNCFLAKYIQTRTNVLNPVQFPGPFMGYIAWPKDTNHT